MAGKRTILYRLLEAAQDRCVKDGQIMRWCLANGQPLQEAITLQAAAEKIARKALDAAEQGCYVQARAISSLHGADDFLQEDEVTTASRLRDAPPLKAFHDTCKLADQINRFLMTAEKHGSLEMAFAEDCRHDLTTLLVLADWCEEHNLPAVAAEARRLYSLIRL